MYDRFDLELVSAAIRDEFGPDMADRISNVMTQDAVGRRRLCRALQIEEAGATSEEVWHKIETEVGKLLEPYIG